MHIPMRGRLVVDNASHISQSPSLDSLLSDMKASDDKAAQNKAAENKNESTWSKVSREAYVLGDGLVSGFSKGAEQSVHDPLGTGLRLATAVGTGVALTLLSRGGAVPALIAEGLGAGMGLSFAYDVVRPTRLKALSHVVDDTWRSDSHTQANVGVVSDQLGRFAFDTALMSVGAIGGGLAKGRPFFEDSTLLRSSRAPSYESMRSGSLGATTKFLGDTGTRQLPALDAFPAETLTAPKYGRVLTAQSLSLPLGDVQRIDRLTWLKDLPKGPKELEWQPSEASIATRVDAQSFVKAFMAKDYKGALDTTIEAKVLQRVELNNNPQLQSVNITASELKDPETLQYHMSQISKIGVFDWRQKISGADILETRLRVNVPRTVVELNAGKAKVALVDFIKTENGGYYNGYKTDYPTVDIKGQKLTPEQLSEIEAIRKSPEGQRVLAETALIAFEESIAHANQHISAGGDIISPTYARFTRDFGIEHGTRPQLLSFLGMMGKEHPAKVTFNEQEVPAILYDAGMPLPLIEHHYFFGGRHVPERTPVFEFLRKAEASSDYDFSGPQPPGPEEH